MNIAALPRQLPRNLLDPERSPPRTRLYGVGTAVPPFSIGQAAVCKFMSSVLESADQSLSAKPAGWMERLYAASGIENRCSVLPDYTKENPEDFEFFPKNWALEPFPTTAARMKVYERWSVELAQRAAERALSQAKVPAGSVTHLIIASCTGFFAPGPDVLLIQKLGLRSDVKRCLLGFMGCYAGFNGMRLADEIVRGQPDAVVLQICVELCTLHFQKRRQLDFQVANSLFSDGAAAALYGATDGQNGGLADVLGTHSRVSADSLEQMAWHIGDHGFEMRLDSRIPRTLKDNVPAFTEELLLRARTSRGDVAGWAIHPGGRKIVEGIRDALGLDDDLVRSSFDVLRDYGNMSSATIFFVLEKELRRRRGPVVAMGFGPGLTMEGAVLSAL